MGKTGSLTVKYLQLLCFYVACFVLALSYSTIVQLILEYNTLMFVFCHLMLAALSCQLKTTVPAFITNHFMKLERFLHFS